MNRRSIAVFGLGMIGTSLALDLRDAGFSVAGYDLSAESAQSAMRLGALDAVLASPAGSFDVVVLAAPPKANLALLDAEAQAALWMDAGSVKEEIVGRARERALPFVGGHPLAGSEGGGPLAARRGLFRGRGFALCPAGGPEELARELVLAVGGRPFRIDPGEHDQAVARSSHLVYAWSCALAQLLEETSPDLLGPAAREMLRVATSPEGLWAEILEMNRAHVQEALREAQEALSRAAGGDGRVLSAARSAARRLREEAGPDAG